MKKIALIGLVAVAIMLVPAPPSDAFPRHRGAEVRVFVGVGPSWSPYWYRYPPPPYYVYPAPPVVYSAPVIVPPPVYAVPAPPAYWYYCQSFGSYYPHVPSCPEPWVPIPAR